MRYKITLLALLLLVTFGCADSTLNDNETNSNDTCSSELLDDVSLTLMGMQMTTTLKMLSDSDLDWILKTVLPTVGRMASLQSSMSSCNRLLNEYGTGYQCRGPNHETITLVGFSDICDEIQEGLDISSTLK